MNQIETSVLAKVESVLKSLNLNYAIVDSDGNTHGELAVQQTKKVKRRRSIYPLGEIRGYIMPHMEKMALNTTSYIPVGKYQAEVVRGSVSSYATQLWGSGNYKTKVMTDKKSVEVTRFDKNVANFMKQDFIGDLFEGLIVEKPQRLTRETFNASS